MEKSYSCMQKARLDRTENIRYTLIRFRKAIGARPMITANILNPFLLSFIPILVALDAPGTLPLYVGMTEGVKKQERRKIVRQSIITAFLVTIGFILLGQAIFNALGILVADFMIAGGLVLLIIAVTDVVRAGERKMERSPEFGVVPLGTPLIAGPGTLTAALVLVGTNGYIPVVLSLIVNLLIAWLIFAQAERIIRLIGISGSRAFAKVASLILAAFAVKMMRSGMFLLLEK